MVHGDIRPGNIFVTNSGNIKIAEQSTLAINESGYALALANRGKPLLSPILINSLNS